MRSASLPPGTNAATANAIISGGTRPAQRAGGRKPTRSYTVRTVSAATDRAVYDRVGFLPPAR